MIDITPLIKELERCVTQREIAEYKIDLDSDQILVEMRLGTLKRLTGFSIDHCKNKNYIDEIRRSVKILSIQRRAYNIETLESGYKNPLSAGCKNPLSAGYKNPYIELMDADYAKVKLNPPFPISIEEFSKADNAHKEYIKWQNRILDNAEREEFLSGHKVVLKVETPINDLPDKAVESLKHGINYYGLPKIVDALERAYNINSFEQVKTLNEEQQEEIINHYGRCRHMHRVNEHQRNSAKIMFDENGKPRYENGLEVDSEAPRSLSAKGTF